MNNDSNEFRKIITNLAKKGNIILQKIKSTNMRMLSIMSMKTKVDLKVFNTNMKSFTENLI